MKYSETPLGQHRHFHDDEQLLYIEEGFATVRVEGREYPASGGDLVIFSRHERHAVAVEGALYKRYSVHLEGEQSDDFLASVLIDRGEAFRHVIHAPELGSLFRELEEEFSVERPLRGRMLGLRLQEIFVTLFRREPSLFVKKEAAPMQRIRRYIEENFRKELTLSKLAEEHNISCSHLSHQFKAVTGYAPMEYLLVCRMTAAQKRLAETDCSVREIVEECGFSDQSNFSRSFRRRMGCSPLEFRKKYQKP
ncbi:MAG: AraC family transcriptional regulator [Clostridia bacterium]|nr:AraC family transcriptional regulator [Clostridia bacterium]